MNIHFALESLWLDLEQLYGPLQWPGKQLLLWRILRIQETAAAQAALNEALKDNPAAATLVSERIQTLNSRVENKGLFPTLNTKKERFNRIPVLYATDRESSQPDPLNSPYGPGRDPAEELRFGVAEVSVPERHKPGPLEVPKWWKLEFDAAPEKHLCLLGVRERSADDFASKLADLLDGSARPEILIFIHGFNNSFADAAVRAAQLATDCEFPGPVLLYSWPSQNSAPLYTWDSSNVEWTQPRFRSFVALVQERFPTTRIHCLAHSMGGRLLRWMLEQPLAPAASPLGETIFAAPDVDRQSFARAAQDFAGKSSRVTLYASSADKALLLSHKANGYPRAGDARGDILVQKGIDTIDATAVDSHLLKLNHSYIGDCRELLSDLHYLIAKGMAINERHGLRKVEYGRDCYYELK